MIRKVAIVLTMIGASVFALLWVASICWYVSWTFNYLGGCAFIELRYGSIQWGMGPGIIATPGLEIYVFTRHQVIWWSSDPGFLPLWIPAVLCAIYPLVTFVRWRQHKRSQGGLCAKCGYDLTGNVSGVCPECGREIQRA